MKLFLPCCFGLSPHQRSLFALTMGCAGGKQASGSPEEQERQKAIERMLKTDRTKYEKEVKLLLLGAGQSGKSTLAKQMKIIYLEGFSDDERRAYQEIVNANIFTAVRDLLQGVRQEGLQLQAQSEVVLIFRTHPSCV